MKYKDIGESEKLDQVIKEMKNIFRTVPYGVDHTMKVLENTRTVVL
jgi:ureidoglycolate hydrolase